MITIPTSDASPPGDDGRPKPPDSLLLMAAAEMHRQGRLVEPAGETAPTSDADREQYNEDEKSLRLGEDADKEAFVKKYGLQEGIDRLQDEIDRLGQPTGGGEKAYKKELETWRGRFHERLKEGVPQS